MQVEVWQKLSINTDFHSQRVYPSAHQLLVAYVQKYLDPITSELGLRHYARETVENPVRTLIQEIHGNEQLREQFRLRGTMMFESHTNLGQTSIDEEIEHLSITEPNTSNAGGRRASYGHWRRSAFRYFGLEVSGSYSHASELYPFVPSISYH
jgi:hypothetical protein